MAGRVAHRLGAPRQLKGSGVQRPSGRAPGVVRYTIRSTKDLTGCCHSLITDYRQPSHVSIHRWQLRILHTMCPFLLKQSMSAVVFDLAMNLCVQQPWPKPGQRPGICLDQSDYLGSLPVNSRLPATTEYCLLPEVPRYLTVRGREYVLHYPTALSEVPRHLSLFASRGHPSTLPGTGTENGDGLLRPQQYIPHVFLYLHLAHGAVLDNCHISHRYLESTPLDQALGCRSTERRALSFSFMKLT